MVQWTNMVNRCGEGKINRRKKRETFIYTQWIYIESENGRGGELGNRGRGERWTGDLYIPRRRFSRKNYEPGLLGPSRTGHWHVCHHHYYHLSSIGQSLTRLRLAASAIPPHKPTPAWGFRILYMLYTPNTPPHPLCTLF